MSSARVKDLLEKTKNYDADERFMAMHDLVEQLKSMQGSIETALQVPVRDTILRLLNDGSSDVATVTVKCLSQLVTKLAADQISYIAERLGSIISSSGRPPTAAPSSSSSLDDDSQRSISLDVVSDSLQTIISSSSPENGRVIAPKLLGSLLTALSAAPNSADVDRTMSCLTLLKQVLERYGSDIADQQKAISKTLLSLLSHPQDAVKKRASVTLGPLVYILDDALFASVMQTLITGMDSRTAPEIYIQSVSAISKAAGVRVGAFLPAIMPKLSAFLTMTRGEEEGEEPEERRVELLETSLQAIEAVILRCPTKVTPYVPQLVQTAITWSQYDPMYQYDDDAAADDDDFGSSAMRDDSQQRGKPRQQDKSDGNMMSDDPDEEARQEDGDGWGEGGGGGDEWGDDDGAAAAAGASTEKAAEWGAEDEEAGGISAGSNDTSWKVRRAAVGVLGAFIKARSDLLRDYYTTLFDHIVRRMKERDSAVKEELLFACRDLLHESVVTDRPQQHKSAAAAAANSHHSHKPGSSSFSSSSPEPLPTFPPSLQTATSLPEHDDGPLFATPAFSRTRSTYGTLDAKTPALIRSVEQQFAGADIRTQQAIFAVWTELFQVRHGLLAHFLPRVVPHCINGITATGKQAAVNADALLFVRLVLESHGHSELQPHLAAITAATIRSVRVGLPKNIPAALAVLTAVSSHLPFTSPPSLVSSLSSDIFRVVSSQLEQTDVPLDVKLSSISTMAALLSSAGRQLQAEAKRVWPVFAERMRNESTCQPVLRAVSKVASSGSVDCSAMVEHTEEMVAFIRKSSHHLRHNTVKCIECLLTAHPAAFHAPQVSLIIAQTNPYIDDSDLQLAHLVLDLLSTVLRTSLAASGDAVAAVLAAVGKDVTPRAIALACSPLLQGQSLHSLIAFFRQLVRSKPSSASSPSSSLSYAALLSSLLSCVSPTLNKPAFSTLSQCIAAMTEEASEAERAQVTQQMITNVKKETTGTTTRSGSRQRNTPLTHLSLLFLGEVGRTRDLSALPELERVLLSSFNSDSEEVRNAAAFALGNVTLGNMQLFLPRLLQLIQTEKFSYLLLSALKEIIAHYSTSTATLASFSPYLASVSPILFQHADSSDESTRAMVSECLGRITVVSPAALLPRLVQLTASPSPQVRAVCITALRFTFTPLMDSALLQQHLQPFLALVNDPELEVKRQTILTMNALFRAHVELLDSQLLSSVVLPALFLHTKPVPSLIREIDYGAFKTTVDDGKPLRKAAFQALASLLETAPHRLDLHRLIVALQQGLTDQEDIQLSSYLTYSQLAAAFPQVVLESLDQLPKLMMAPIKAHLAAAKSKEPEAAIDCLRACVRCMLQFNAMDGVELCTAYTHFFKQVCATPLLVTIIKETQAQEKSI